MPKHIKPNIATKGFDQDSRVEMAENTLSITESLCAQRHHALV